MYCPEKILEKIMKEIIFDKNNYSSYKDFYIQLYNELEGKKIPDWEDYDYLHYNAGLLDEFLWYCHNDNIKYVFVNFDKEKIALKKNYDDYEYGIVIKVFERFVKQYPNNKLEFKFEEDKN